MRDNPHLFYLSFLPKRAVFNARTAIGRDSSLSAGTDHGRKGRETGVQGFSVERRGNAESGDAWSGETRRRGWDGARVGASLGAQGRGRGRLPVLDPSRPLFVHPFSGSYLPMGSCEGIQATPPVPPVSHPSTWFGSVGSGLHGRHLLSWVALRYTSSPSRSILRPDTSV